MDVLMLQTIIIGENKLIIRPSGLIPQAPRLEKLLPQTEGRRYNESSAPNI
jgi:hypothetical protein